MRSALARLFFGTLVLATGYWLLATDSYRLLATEQTAQQPTFRGGVTLVLWRWHDAGEAARWNPSCWIALGRPPLLIATEPPGGLLSGQRAQSVDLYAQLAPPGAVLPVRSEFDLLKNPVALALVGAFFGLLAYAAIDGLSNPHELVGDYLALRSLAVFALPLLLAPVSGLLRRAGLPGRRRAAGRCGARIRRSAARLQLR